MKYIKELQRRKKVEIFMWLLLVILTYHLWNSPIFALAYLKENRGVIEVIEDGDYESVLYQLADDELGKADTYDLILTNDTSINEQYKLYIGISNNVNQKNIKIYDGKITQIKDLISVKKDDYTYYLYDISSLQAENRNYYFKLYNGLGGKNNQAFSLKILLEKI